MKLIIAEKNDAARQIAERLSTGKPKKDKVYNTAIYRFEWKGEECVTIGLAGHILAPDFCDSVLFDKKLGWYSVTEDGEMLPADIPDGLARPPYDTKRKPFLADGISIKGWKLESLPYLTWAPVIKLPAEKELIRSLKNLAKKSDSVIIATDFDREGELIGSDALNKVREVAPDLPVARAQYSSFTKAEITQAFDNLVSLDQNLADAGESRQHIDLIWGAVLTRYLTLAKFGGFGNVRSAGRVQTPTLALVVERERERMAFVPEDYWQIRGMGAAQGAAEDDRFKIAHKTARFTDKDAAETAYGHVDGAKTATVAAVTKRSRKQQPPTPFATTSLQAAAAAEGISPARTMRIAESLYMAGLISYPRVDNTVYPATLDLGAVVSDLAKINPALAPVCKKVLAGPMKPTRGKVETTDHTPIYPTGEGDPSTLDGGQRKLYDLIARRNHARREIFERHINKVLQLGKLDNAIKISVDELLGIAEQGAVQIDVLAGGQLEVKAGTKLNQRRDVTVHLNAALARLKLASDNLEHRGFAGAVGADQAHDLATVNIKRDMLERPKLLKEQFVLGKLDEVLLEVGQRLGRHVKDHGDVVDLDSQRLLAVINNRFSHHSTP